MRNYLGLTRRNLLVYFKDIQSIFFSMLTPLIILILYILFLKDTFIEPIERSSEALRKFLAAQDIQMFANGLLLSGILGSSMITVPYNALVTIVRDRENRVDYDICATPVRRGHIILSYFTASAISAFAMSALILSGGLFVLGSMGELYLAMPDLLKLYGVTLLGSVSATALLMVIVLFIRTSSACGAFQGLLSAATGFLIGAYIPLSQFSAKIQSVCNLFPGTGITVLYRNVLLNPILNHIDESLSGIDGGMFVETIKETFTFQAQLFGRTLEPSGIILQIATVIALSVVAILLIYPKVYRRR